MEAGLLEETADTKTHMVKSRILNTISGLAGMAEQEFQNIDFYSRHTQVREPEPLVYEFTRDPALLHQYYRLREQMFISVWGLKHFDGAKDEFDEIHETLIARQGRFCVGGVRFTFSTPNKPAIMPMESNGLDLKLLFPELDLENKIYGECGRFAMLPEFRSRETSHQMLQHIALQHLRYKAAYGFWLAPFIAARSYRQTFASLGVNCKIRTDIEVPDRDSYEGIKMYVGVIDFTTPLVKESKAREMVTA